jgi:DNA helicase II / ATP-dependent DNA helicase PcrA
MKGKIMNKILENLNNEQQQAVLSNFKYLQITAGPGTGKTTTIAGKMLYLLSESEIQTDDILAISFSRSAKTQLLKKIDEFSDVLGYGGKPPILTFHSLAYRTIKNGIHVGESRYRHGLEIVQTEQFQQLNPSLIKDLCTEYTNRDVVNIALSNAYNLIRQGNNLEERPITNWRDIPHNKKYHINLFENGRILIKSEDLKTYWRRINKIEKLNNVTDYQGLISEAIRILNLKTYTFEKLSSSFTHLFIDEYQDTSLAQEEFVLALLNDKHTVTVVGDKNQTIYTFNGSNSSNMERFMTIFSNKNPMNTGSVHLTKNYRSTRQIVKLANDFIKDPTIESVDNQNSMKPVVVETHSIKLAAQFIAKKISDLITLDRYSPADISILYRKDSEYSPQKSHVLEQLSSFDLLPTSIQQQNKNNKDSLMAEILDLKDEYEDEPLKEVIYSLQNKNGNSRLISFVKEAMDQGAYDTDDLTDYLVEMEENEPPIQQDESITLKTIHDAKGLEFPIVFVLYLGDREFPHSSHPDIEEEKRLLYVALTRAKKQLYILGRKGYEFESFLDRCLDSSIEHIKFHSSTDEEKNEGFNKEDKEIIDKTTKELEENERKNQEDLIRLMELF